MRVTLFLIIVHDYTKEAVAQAQKLEAFSEQDTDVALIKASDLSLCRGTMEKLFRSEKPNV